MIELEQFRKGFVLALVGALNNWRVWMGDDELRALHIGFDCTNTEISLSLLTDREPYLDKSGIDPFQEPWPTADWRLTCVNHTTRHKFPDAAELMEWMKGQSDALTGNDDDLFEGSDRLNGAVKQFIFEAVTCTEVLRELRRFHRVAKPMRLRVEWFFDQGEPLETTLE
jgi:hypothetical protein